MKSKWPSKNQWLQFLKNLNKRERKVFNVFASLFLISFLYLSITFYLGHTKVAPALGGTYTEGVAGFPRFINPVYAPLSDADKDLVEVIFAGLMKYGENGDLATDMAESYEVFENGRIYEFKLKDNLFWQDGKKLDADDIVFTVETIQNPDIKSPLRSMWLGVEVNKISDSIVRFSLKNSSSIFLENCTLKIIPQHVWENISAKNFSFSPNNLNPVGSGPYKLQDLSQDSEGRITSVSLIKNVRYHNEGPYISKLNFKFYETESELISAYRKRSINGFSPSSAASLTFCSLTRDPTKCGSSSVHSLTMPRYFAVFFNQENSKLLKNDNVRLALSYGTNKQEIIDNYFLSYARKVDSPVLPDVYGYEQPSTVYEFDPEKAKSILEEEGFALTQNGTREKTEQKQLSFSFTQTLVKGSQNSEVQELQKCLAKFPEIYPEGKITGYFGDQTRNAVIRFQEKYQEEILAPFGLTQGTGDVKSKTREKLNEVCFETPQQTTPLKFSLYTVDQPLMVEIAKTLKKQWQELGAELIIETFDINELEEDILRTRDFESLLFGEALSLIPDPFPFWHSTQKGELGLNIANYANTSADKLLESSRQSSSEEERQSKLEQFQEIVTEDMPAVFLYNPDYIYIVPSYVKGINEKIISDPSKRFTDVSTWYIKTKRIWEL